MASVIEFEKTDRTAIDMLKLKEKRQKRKRKEKCQQCLVRARKFPCNTIRKKFYFTDSPSVKEDEIEYPSKWLEGEKCSGKSPMEQDNEMVERRQKVIDKHTYRSRLSQNILARLKVVADEIPVDAKTDVDQGFFSVVSGRPIGRKFSRREYLTRLGEIANVKGASTGMSKDLEKRKINLFKQEKLYKELNASFTFHQLQSRMCMYNEFSQTEEVHKKEKIAKERRIESFQQRSTIRAKLIQARCRLYKLEEHWRTLKVYQAFLYQLSPLSWRREYDHIHRQLGELIVSALPSIYGPYRLKSLGAEDSLENLIGLFYTSLQNEKHPEMYFKNPSQLKSSFEYIIQMNSHGAQYLKEVKDTANEIRGYCKELSKVYESKMRNIPLDHERFTKAFNWVNDRRNHLQATAMEKRNDLISTVMGELHSKVQKEIWISGDRYMTLKKLMVEMGTILQTFQEDAHSIVHEYMKLPPKVARLAFQAVRNKIKLLKHIDRNSKGMKTLEKHLYDAYTMKDVHKRRKFKARSSFPTAKKANVTKDLERDDDDFYTEDIFNIYTGYQPTVVGSQLRGTSPSYIAESVFTHQEISITSTESSEKSGSTLELPERDSIVSICGKSISKLSTATSSSGSSQALNYGSKQMQDQMKYTRKDSASYYPNNTINWTHVDVKNIILEKKKPLLVMTHKKEDTQMKVITKYEDEKANRKEAIIIEKTDELEITTKRRDVERESALKDEHLGEFGLTSVEFDCRKSHRRHSQEDLRWENVTCIQAETESNFRRLMQKTQHTTKKRFRPTAENQPDIKFIQSPYLPTLPTTLEKPENCQNISDPLEFMDPKLEKELRALKQTFYKYKNCLAQCTVKKILY